MSILFPTLRKTQKIHAPKLKSRVSSPRKKKQVVKPIATPNPDRPQLETTRRSLSRTRKQAFHGNGRQSHAKPCACQRSISSLVARARARLLAMCIVALYYLYLLLLLRQSSGGARAGANYRRVHPLIEIYLLLAPPPADSCSRGVRSFSFLCFSCPSATRTSPASLFTRSRPRDRTYSDLYLQRCARRSEDFLIEETLLAVWTATLAATIITEGSRTQLALFRSSLQRGLFCNTPFYFTEIL